MRLIVTAVKVETVDVSSFAGLRDRVTGRTSVEFQSRDGYGDTFELSWSPSWTVPVPGSTWTLIPDGEA